MPLPSLSEQVAAATGRREWDAVRRALLDADRDGRLDGAELESLALACWWLGRVNEAIEVRQRAFDCYHDGDDRQSAARVALLLSEDHRRQARGAVGDSWRRRAAHLLDGVPESLEHGYLLLYEGERARRSGDLVGAERLLGEAAATAHRLNAVDLGADVAQELGRVMILDERPLEGTAVMDEAMLAASEGRLGAYTTGKVYCCMMSACDDTGDIERLVEWRNVGGAWSDEHGLDVFPGMCRVHHAELLALFGHWPQAEQAALRACDELEEVGWVVAYAYNTLGHLRRCRGDVDGAERAFHEARQRGTASESGLALIQLARGDREAALRGMTRALISVPSPALTRARLLPAMVEIAIAAASWDQAAAAAAELDGIAAAYRTAKLRGEAAMSRGRVYLATGDVPAACVALDAALAVWQQLGAPYEEARTRVLQARACRLLADDDGCASQLQLAASTFRSLGATADLAEVELLGAPAPAHHGPLTGRELEVLRLLATGATNRQIAATLHVSEKTVSRHLGNIFTKIGVSTRAAATAFAYRTSIIDDRS